MERLQGRIVISWPKDRKGMLSILESSCGGKKSALPSHPPPTPALLWEGSHSADLQVKSRSLGRPESLATHRLVG